MNEFLTTATLIGIAHSGVRLATPYLFAATGEMFGQRSGVLNLGVEGVMLMGAFAAYYAVFLGGDPWLGVLAALAVGALMGLLMALISVTMQAEQGISGIGLTLFGLGLSSLLLKVLVGSPISIEGFSVLRIPVLSDIPLVGPVLFDHDVLVYLAYLMVPVSIFLLNRTTWGLKIRAVGQNPEAADSLGVRVNALGPTARTRMVTAAMHGYRDNIDEIMPFDPDYDLFDPDHIARVMLYLVSPQCAFTGRFLAVRADDVYLFDSWTGAHHASNGGKAWTQDALAAALAALPPHQLARTVGPMGGHDAPFPGERVLEQLQGAGS